MYGLPIHLYVVEELTHIVERSQAAAEVQELVQPKRLSLVARLLNKLPVRSRNRQLALDVPYDEYSLSSIQCE